MLSRDADSCFWIGRYIERAEATARMVDVHYHFGLEMPRSGAEIRWSSILAISGGEELYESRYETEDERSIIQFFAFDLENTDSILSCLQAARENARGIREQISSEMWESLNATYLEMRDWSVDRALQVSPHEFFKWIKNRSHLFQGITNRTLLIGESRDFLDSGRFLERAGQTARILDVKYHDLLPDAESVGGPVDIHGWIAVLKSVGAYEAFRKTFRQGVTPAHVAAFLVLNEHFPASVRHSIGRVDGCLKRITKSAGLAPGNAAESAVKELHDDLTAESAEDVINKGLHEFLQSVLTRCDGIGQAIAETYLRY